MTKIRGCHGAVLRVDLNRFSGLLHVLNVELHGLPDIGHSFGAGVAPSLAAFESGAGRVIGLLSVFENIWLDGNLENVRFYDLSLLSYFGWFRREGEASVSGPFRDHTEQVWFYSDAAALRGSPGNRCIVQFCP